MFSFVMDARSLITRPAYPTHDRARLGRDQGIAWTGAGKIARVDVSTDGGTTWNAATLQEPVLSRPYAFRHRMEVDRRRGDPHEPRGGRDRLRAADPRRRCWRSGPGTPTYHLNPITGWVVRADGAVVFREEPWG